MNNMWTEPGELGPVDRTIYERVLSHSEMTLMCHDTESVSEDFPELSEKEVKDIYMGKVLSTTQEFSNSMTSAMQPLHKSAQDTAKAMDDVSKKLKRLQS